MEYINIKITTIFPDWPLKRQMPNENFMWDKYKFFIDDKRQDCDYWIIYGGLLKKEQALCPKECVFFMSGEPETIKTYNRDFLAQFSKVISCQKGLEHKNLIQSQPAFPWYAGVRLKRWKYHSYTLNYDYFKENKPCKKKLLSVITSNKRDSIGHIKRIEFVEKLKAHFGSTIDVFGRGINDFEDKWEVLKDYKYHIVIENSKLEDYFTEKLNDCFLASTFPFYYGCNNIEKYFPNGSYEVINIENAEEAIKIIEKNITEKRYEKSESALDESKTLVLEKYNLIPTICSLVSNINNSSIKKENIFVAPEYEFLNDIKGHIFCFLKDKKVRLKKLIRKIY